MNWKSLILIVAVVCATILFGFNINNNKPLENNDKYKSLWKQVENHQESGLPKSAKEVVDKIYERALQDNNHPQRVKALIHQFKYIKQLEKVENPEIFKRIQNEILISQSPTKNILHSMLADLYWQYLQQNRNKYYNRTETVAFDNEDILTWSLEKIYKNIIDNHNQALQNDSEIKQTLVEDFDDIINLTDKNGYGNPRPTLYDFIANRAIDFLQNDESSITKPVYAFTLNDKNVFGETRNFINENYTSKDTLSNKLYALKIFQQLESFHKNDENKLPLMETTLRRLRFAHNNAIIGNKDNLFENALKNLIQQFKNNEVSTEASFYLAQYYLNLARKYLSEDKKDFGKYKKMAFDVCEKAVQKFPKSFGSINCESLVQQIQRKELRFQMEEANNPNENLRALVEYQNVNKVFCKLIKLDKSTYEDLENQRINQDDKLKYLNQLPDCQNWSVNLPSSEDFLNHKVEIKVDALEIGYYYMLVSDNSNFSFRGNAVAFNPFWITKYAVVEKKHKSDFNFYVVNRKTGEPLEQVKLNIYKSEYNRKKRRNEYKFITSTVSAKEGIATVNNIGDRNRVKVEIDDFNDFYNYTTYIDKNYHNYTSGEQNIIQLFTDRSIYRPGQKVYFKGIAYKTANNKHTLNKGFSTKVELKDANYQNVESQDFTTNEFGTFNGSFVLPQTGLTGRFTLQTPNGQVQINVEEYKRPKFEVTFDTIKESYSLNENVSLKGNAITYSGANLDNVKVDYIVERKANFPYWWGWFCGIRPPFSAEKMIIAQGETTTDENGKFTINFNAKPDESLSEESKPIFNYTVTAKVIDSTGETQENTTTVRAGYIALDVSMTSPEIINTKEDASISVSTKNLNGAFEAANLNISINKLQEPQRLLRNRYWQKPDQFLFTEQEYIGFFPNDIYKNENQYYEWKSDKNVKKVNERSTKNYKVDLKTKNLKAGKYQVVLKTKDKNRKEIEIIQYFSVVDEKQKSYTQNNYLDVFAVNNKVKPNDVAKVLVNSAHNKLYLHSYRELKDKIAATNYEILNRQQKLFTTNVSKQHIGDFTMKFWTVIDNRYLEKEIRIEVPHPTKKLRYEWISFRDKLQPNVKEEWKLKIFTENNEKATAELLATMYDASLDAFKPHNYNFNLYFKKNHSKISLQSKGFGLQHGQVVQKDWNLRRQGILNKKFDQFDWQGFSIHNNYYAIETLAGSSKGGMLRNMKSKMSRNAPAPMQMDAMAESAEDSDGFANADAVTISETEAANVSGVSSEESTEKPKTDFSQIKARGNLVETAFFLPDLKTDKDGNVIISFKTPETLTKWKILGFGHTPDLDFGLFEKEMRTQKDLMVTPNAPRFFRENDKITFTAKVNNISDKQQNGTAILQLFDATTNKLVDGNFGNSNNERSFNIASGASQSFEWNLQIPDNVEAITYKVLAKAGNLSDGEQNSLPVLKNRMMVTETMPLPLRSKQSKTFVFDKFKNNTSSTLQNYSYTLEFTSNPAWYAVQALPYLMDYPNQCAEQIFSRIYANSLASEIANSQPKIKAVFDEWKSTNSDALVSNLEKNQELKMLLLEETPWVMEAKDETERKKRIALLFDLNKMSKEYKNDVQKLLQLQKADGGFGWFSGMRSNRYITQHIVTGFGKLDNLNVKAIKQDQKLYNAIRNAVDFLDRELRDDYRNLKRSSRKLSDRNVSNIHLHYLYARSFFKDIPIPSDSKVAFDYYLNQSEKYWNKFGFYEQGLIAMALHRNNLNTKMITNSLKENMLDDEELGKFFKYNKGYYWHQAPIESQAMMIEVFSEIEKDVAIVDDLKVWLLKQKQVQDWKTTKATVEAIYALLLQGSNWISETKQVEIKLNGQKFDPFKNSNFKAEAGSGYFKTKWFDKNIDKSLATIKISNPNNQLAWGAAYWQYFENLDKITFAETPLSLKKTLFKQIKTDKGFKIEPITKNALKVGDKVIVRIELRVDRTMNYVHMKDMRSSGFEPVNVLSQYKYQDGLGYYESTRDASTNFFFDVLREGTYVFEYPLKVYHKGDFSNGITSIQCMYAPEFTSHSEGVRVLVD